MGSVFVTEGGGCPEKAVCCITHMIQCINGKLFAVLGITGLV